MKTTLKEQHSVDLGTIELREDPLTLEEIEKEELIPFDPGPYSRRSLKAAKTRRRNRLLKQQQADSPNQPEQ